MSAGLAAALRPVLAAAPAEKAVAMYGTADAAELASWLERYCLDSVGEAPRELAFAGGFSAGVFGLVLESGKRAVVKLHKAGARPGHLARAYSLQENARARGIPCAQLLSPPSEFISGMQAVSHEFFAPGQPEDCATPGHRREIAHGLCRVIAALRDGSGEGLNTYGLQPFEVPPGVGEQLGAIQNRALAELRALDQKLLIAHADMKGRNLHFENGRLSAIYDFDSLIRISEPNVVGAVSVDFMSSRGQMKINLDAEVSLGFVREYEQARGKPFSRKEMDGVRAGAVVRLVRIGVYFLDREAAGIPEARLAGAIDAFDRVASRLFR